MRAREPDQCGFAVRRGVRLYYEVTGTGPTTVVLLPPWSINHSRMWKLQVPFLARQHRVVTFDGRGNGRSDRPAGAAAYGDAELLADVVAVLDAAGVDRAVGVGLSMGGRSLLQLAAEHPERLLGAVFVAPSLVLDDVRRTALDFEAVRDSYDGWEKWNRHYWRQDHRDFVEFFFDEVFPEAHSTRQHEDSVAWAMESTADSLVDSMAPERPTLSPAVTRDYAARVRCPSLVLHGTDDRIVPVSIGERFARLVGAPFEAVVDGGHLVQARHPVWFNLRLRRFVDQVAA